MFLPYNVDVPMERLPVANWLLIAVTSVATLLSQAAPNPALSRAITLADLDVRARSQRTGWCLWPAAKWPRANVNPERGRRPPRQSQHVVATGHFEAALELDLALDDRILGCADTGQHG